MALFYGDSNIMPHFVSSKTARGLHKKIMKLQNVSGKQYSFISIYFDNDKKEHIAWYYELKDENEIISEVLNGDSKE